MSTTPVVHPIEVLHSLHGRKPISAIKKPNPVRMWQMDTEFEVDTAEGRMKGHAGDWLVHDPLSGNYWPIRDEYKQMHYGETSTYEPVEETCPRCQETS